MLRRLHSDLYRLRKASELRTKQTILLPSRAAQGREDPCLSHLNTASGLPVGPSTAARYKTTNDSSSRLAQTWALREYRLDNDVKHAKNQETRRALLSKQKTMTTYAITTIAQCVFRSLSWWTPCKYPELLLPLQHCCRSLSQKTKRRTSPLKQFPSVSFSKLLDIATTPSIHGIGFAEH
jgi:hypothetical protein